MAVAFIYLYQPPQDPQGIQTRIREELRPPSERRQDMLDALVKEFEAENAWNASQNVKPICKRAIDSDYDGSMMEDI